MTGELEAKRCEVTNRKKEYKKRLIKKFIWTRKIRKERRWLGFYYIEQRCRIAKENQKDETNLEWVDLHWGCKQMTFVWCDCGCELCATGSFVSDDWRGVNYKCIECKKESWWNFDVIPGAVSMEGPLKSDPNLAITFDAEKQEAVEAEHIVNHPGSHI